MTKPSLHDAIFSPAVCEVGKASSDVNACSDVFDADATHAGCV